MQKHPYSVKWIGSPVLTVPELYKIYSINQTLNLFTAFGGFKGQALIYINIVAHRANLFEPHTAT